MSHQRHDLVLAEFRNEMGKAVKIVAAAQQWYVKNWSFGPPKFTAYHRNLLAEYCFLRSYLAWEQFLEESFLLYSLGKRTPKRYAPHRNLVPRSRKHLWDLLLLETRRKYVDWDNLDLVISRAERYFDNGEPYKSTLRRHQKLLEDLQTLRNALAHRSASSQERFKVLLRRELTTAPLKMTVGAFLMTNRPTSPTPQTYLEFYSFHLDHSALAIVPI